MKKLFGTLFGILLGVMILCAGVYAAEDYDDYTDFPVAAIYLNGEYVHFDGGSARIIDSNVYVPMREMFQELNAEVLWDSDKNVAIGTIGDISVEFIANESEYKINDTKYMLNSPVRIIDGKTYVPVRALCEAFGCDVEWKMDESDYYPHVCISYLRPLSEDERFLYDCAADESYTTVEIMGTSEDKLNLNGVDISLTTENHSKESNGCKIENIKVKGDIYREVLKVDADIEVWRETKDGNTEVFYRVNGEEDTLGLAEAIIPYTSLKYDTFGEIDTLNSFFNDIEIKSVKTENNNKIYEIAVKVNDDKNSVEIFGETSGEVFGEISVDITQKRINRMVFNINEEYTGFGANDDTYTAVTRKEWNIKYTDEVLTRPDYFKDK